MIDLLKPPVYLPFSSRWRLALGMRPLDLRHWIEIDEAYAEELSLKAHLLQTRSPQVRVALPDSQPSQQEALDLLLQHLLDRFPGWFTLHNGVVRNHLTQEQWSIAEFAHAPIELAARLVQEDLCLMQADGEYSLSAACVCFPARWQPPEKLGRPLHEIHAPVPEFDRVLATPANQYFDRLRVEHPGWRLNWALVETPDLFLPDSPNLALLAEVTAENAGDRLWLRVERQTLRRLPISRAVLFTIRTYCYPLRQIVMIPDGAADFQVTIDTMPDEMQHYKGIAPVRSALTQYLQAFIHSQNYSQN